ncbi:MAG: YgaP family membrane protein [Hoeflea sp.]|uniref:YgaP family membrane protein n=1 Tax=Hoeflea sp. TaxID=1940281 RepID=UPI003EF7E9EC
MFKSNVGGFDRALRVVAGLVLLSMLFVYPDASWRYFALIGIVPLFTGLFGTCPLYSLFGMSTCPVSKS